MGADAQSVATQNRHDRIAIAAANLHHGTKFFVEKRLIGELQALHCHLFRANLEVAPIGGIRVNSEQIKIDRQTTPPGKGHFGKRYEQPPIRAIVIGKNFVLTAQFGQGRRQFRQLCRVVQIGAIRPNLPRDLRQCRSTQTLLAARQIDQNQDRLRDGMQLRRPGRPDILKRRKRGDHQRNGRCNLVIHCGSVC